MADETAKTNRIHTVENIMHRSIYRSWALLLVGLGLAPMALAQNLPKDELLADRAELILLGRVLDRDPLVGIGLAETDYLIEVESVVKGGLLHSPLVVRVANGGIPLANGLEIFGTELLRLGEQILLFLRPIGDDAMTFEIVDTSLGAFHIQTFNGREVAYRSFWPAQEPFDAGLPGIEHAQLRDLELFRRWLDRHAGGIDAKVDYFRAENTADLVDSRNGTPARRPLGKQVGVGVLKGLPSNGMVSDPADGTDPSFPDLISANLSSNGSSMTLRSQYVANTFNVGNARTAYYIDLDENIATGFGAISDETTNTLGVERIIKVHNNQAQVRLYNPTAPPGGPLFTIVDNLPATPLADGHLVTLSLDLFDDDSVFAYKVLVDQVFGPVYTRPWDYMPNLNLPPATTRAPVVIPATPSNLQADAGSPEQVQLTWDDNSTNENRFEIERRTDVSSYQLIANVAANSTSFTDNGISSATSYSYRIRASNAAGDSAYSNVASITTPGEAAPSDLVANATSESEIALAWTDNAANESGYSVEIQSSDGSFGVLQSLSADSGNATVGGLSEATAYTFRVRATGGAGDSSPSNEASATTFFANSEPCVAGPNTLCLNDGRFKAEVTWGDFTGETGLATDAGLASADSGLMYFFSPDNWEMVVKVLDGCAVTDHFWVFAAVTTNVEYTLTVTDTLTGLTKDYTNPLGDASPALTDTEAFATCAAQAPPAGSPATDSRAAVKQARPAAPVKQTGSCTASDTSLCVNQERFQVEVDWTTQEGSGSGHVDPFQSADSGLFWFFSPNNLEMLVKVLDGCAINGRVWVFAAASTDVEYTLRVLDTETGVEKRYLNIAGNAAAAITDTDAFEACP